MNDVCEGKGHMEAKTSLKTICQMARERICQQQSLKPLAACSFMMRTKRVDMRPRRILECNADVRQDVSGCNTA